MKMSRGYMMHRLGLTHPATINDFAALTFQKFGKQFPCQDPQVDAQAGKHNMMTRYFCGFHPACANVCSSAALARAKKILTQEYMLVGVLEELETTLKLLERMVRPRCR